MSAKLFERRMLTIGALCVIPCFFALLGIFGPFLTDTVYLYSGVAVNVQTGALAGYPTIDPNAGFTAFALGARAALDLLSGHLPLWNHYEGLGTPLLGEMQSAALFPPTLLLALPHGQVLEQVLLQLVAGVGSFLFFRRFGLETRAALSGSLLFEVNGVFAWLRNAIFNPVAFLPWLFFAVESMHVAATAERPLRQRLPMICMGAAMAAMALYAGFPEEVYLYSLMLVGWVVLRLTELSIRQARTFVSDLLLTGLIALALSAPVLVAFVDFLREAALGGHGGSGFSGTRLNSAAIIQYMMPYIYGPIFASTNQTIRNIWANTGGYIGFAPIVVALAGLFSPGRRAVKIFLAGWVFVALGVTHGLPGIYQAFTALPLVKITAFYRFLNVGWIFCVVFLSALFIDELPALPRAKSRRMLIGAVACGVLLIVAAAVDARSPLIASDIDHRAFIVGALASAAVLSFCVVAAACLRSTRATATAVAAILVAEGVVWFFVPYFSYPRDAGVDNDAIAFLRANIGYQRILNTAEAGLAPNYGSSYGIPQLNFNDLPTPEATAEYIKANLDPFADETIFIPDWPQKNADRAAILRERLSRYAEAGVKYVLAGADFGFDEAFPVSPANKYAYRLDAGARVEIAAPTTSPKTSDVTAISLLIGTYNGISTGHLKVTLCSGATCAEGVSDLASAEDNKPLRIALSRPVRIEAGAKYSISIEKPDGDEAVALWMFPLTSTNTGAKIVESRTPVRDNYFPDLQFSSSAEARLVRQGRSMSIYELPRTRSYFSAPSCTLVPLSHDRLDASCTGATKLLRLELFMRGWSATVNGQAAPVALAEGVFQSIDLPAGSARVQFTFEPPGFRLALLAAAAALLFVCTISVSAVRARRFARQEMVKLGN